MPHITRQKAGTLGEHHDNSVSHGGTGTDRKGLEFLRNVLCGVATQEIARQGAVFLSSALIFLYKLWFLGQVSRAVLQYQTRLSSLPQ